VSNAASLVDIDHLLSKVKERYGRIDAIFINAGVAKFGPFPDMPENVFDETFTTNVCTAPLNFGQVESCF
jgi:NAD(P)-dependent dehydrogenase (short-subunit alcohol dehydrogenase family)